MIVIQIEMMESILFFVKIQNNMLNIPKTFLDKILHRERLTSLINVKELI